MPQRPPARELRLIGLAGIPEITPGADLADVVLAAAGAQGVALASGDILVVAQKIVSKAEGALADLGTIAPSPLARAFAETWGKDPRFIEVVLSEARRIVRMERGVIIAETRHGFVCANGGVDASNVPGEGRVSLLPRDPDGSAARLRKAIGAAVGAEVGVIISDTFGRPWREGLVNVAIGAAGLVPLVSYIGERDPHGHVLRVTELAAADELAAAAGLVMGKLNRIPAVLVRGYGAPPGEGRAMVLVRPPERDLFR